MKITFDTREVKPSSSADFSSIIPKGTYPFTITKVEDKARGENKDAPQNGAQVSLLVRLDGAPVDGRVLWDNMTIVAPWDAEYEAKQRARLSNLHSATGLLGSTDTQDLLGKKGLVVVGVLPAKGEWPEKNIINGYKPLTVEAQLAAAFGAPAPAAREKPSFLKGTPPKAG